MSERYTHDHVTPFEESLRAELVRAGQLLHARGWVAATDGNVTARLGDSHFLATPSGVSKGFMRPADIVVVGWDGLPCPERYGPSPSVKGTTEILLHLEVYRQRPDVQAVVHAHPPIAVTLSIAGIPIDQSMLPEVIVLLGMIPTTAYATPSSPEGATVIHDLILRHDALVLQRHGSVTVGSTVQEAYLRLEKLENAADVTYRLLLLNRPVPLFPPGALDRLVNERERRGLMRPGQRADIERLLPETEPVIDVF